MRLLALMPLLSLPLLSGTATAATVSDTQPSKLLTYDVMFASDAAGTAAADPVWSPDGTRLAYLWEDGEGKALWQLDPASGASSVLLRRDDVEAVLWSPRGDSLLLLAGGDLWLLPATGGAPQRLTETGSAEEDPKFSPDGGRIAFVRDFDLWLLDLATGSERRLTTDGRANTILNGVADWLYWEEIWDRDATGFWWSPDGTRIAYHRFDETGVPVHPIVNESPVHSEVTFQKFPKPGDPNPKVRVGVLDLRSGQTTWMETGEQDQYLARVDWTPAGDAVAIQALSRSQTRLDLLRCGATDGRCASLLDDQWPTWINLGRDFAFLPDGRFLWGSDRDGWRRLYLVEADGRIVRPFSPEGWSVASLDGIAADGQSALVTAFRTQGLGATERHVLRLRLDRPGTETPAETLTSEPAFHEAVVAPRTGAWVHAWASADLPKRAEVRRADGSVVPLPGGPPAGYDPATLPQYEYLTIPGPGGSKLPARLIKPAGFDPSRRYPVITYHYGGPTSQVVQRRWDPRRRDLWHKRMAQRGFVVFSVDNQSSLFFGKTGEDLDYRRMGEVNLAGQLAGVDYLKSLPWVDPSRIGLWGWSGGGYNTLYCLLQRPGVWKAGMAGAPVTDWRLYDSHWTERYLGTPEENPSGFAESSPLTYAANLKDRLLMVHGLADDNVHPQNTIVMSDALIKAGLPFEQAFYPGQKHTFTGASLRHFYERMEEFFERTLGEVVVEGVEVR